MSDPTLNLNLSIVFPVYNEAEDLTKVIADLLPALDGLGPYEIVLSQNGSRDGSDRIADELAMQNPDIRVVHATVADYGFALHRGLEAARGRFVANFSVDFVDVAFLRAALLRIVDCDVVLGSKHLGSGDDQRDWVRRYGGQAFHGLERLTLGIPYSDTHGLKVFRRTAIEPFLPRCQEGGGLFESELVALCHRNGQRIVELPLQVRETRPSRKGIGMLALKSLVGLGRLRLRLLTQSRRA